MANPVTALHHTTQTLSPHCTTQWRSMANPVTALHHTTACQAVWHLHTVCAPLEVWTRPLSSSPAAQCQCARAHTHPHTYMHTLVSEHASLINTHARMPVRQHMPAHEPRCLLPRRPRAAAASAAPISPASPPGSASHTPDAHSPSSQLSPLPPPHPAPGLPTVQPSPARIATTPTWLLSGLSTTRLLQLLLRALAYATATTAHAPGAGAPRAVDACLPLMGCEELLGLLGYCMAHAHRLVHRAPPSTALPPTQQQQQQQQQQQNMLLGTAVEGLTASCSILSAALDTCRSRGEGSGTCRACSAAGAVSPRGLAAAKVAGRGCGKALRRSSRLCKGGGAAAGLSAAAPKAKAAAAAAAAAAGVATGPGAGQELRVLGGSSSGCAQGLCELRALLQQAAGAQVALGQRDAHKRETGLVAVAGGGGVDVRACVYVSMRMHNSVLEHTLGLSLCLAHACLHS